MAIPLLGDKFRALEQKFDKLLEHPAEEMTPEIRAEISSIADDIEAILNFYDILQLPDTDPRKIAILTVKPPTKKKKGTK